MLKLSLSVINAIAQAVKPVFKVIIYWQEPEIYTEEDYLDSVGDLSTSMSEGRYEVANTTVVLKNQDYYFSRRFARELPNNKLIEIFIVINSTDILIFRGTVNKDWKLNGLTLALNTSA